MSKPTGPACGNNPNYRMSDGDRQAVADFRAYLTDRAALRDRIASALTAEHYRRAEARIVASPEEHCAAMAAAVLPVLPPTADQAAVLRWAADQYAKLTDQNEAYDREHGELDKEARLRHEVVRDVVAGLRHLADETPDTAPSVCHAYQPPSVRENSGYCARCGMYDWRHTSQPAAGARQDGAQR
jgi:hypothetical protein